MVLPLLWGEGGGEGGRGVRLHRYVLVLSPNRHRPRRICIKIRTRQNCRFPSIHQSINPRIHAWLGLLSVFLKFLDEHFRVAATLIIFLASAGREIVRRTFGKAPFGLKISKGLRGKSE